MQSAACHLPEMVLRRSENKENHLRHLLLSLPSVGQRFGCLTVNTEELIPSDYLPALSRAEQRERNLICTALPTHQVLDHVFFPLICYVSYYLIFGCRYNNKFHCMLYNVSVNMWQIKLILSFWSVGGTVTGACKQNQLGFDPTTFSQRSNSCTNCATPKVSLLPEIYKVKQKKTLVKRNLTSAGHKLIFLIPINLKIFWD